MEALISVNGHSLDEAALLNEMQYHSGESQREAMIQASESLVVAELLKQRAEELGITIEGDGREEEFLQELLDRDVEIPTASEAECRQYYEKNTEKFQTSPLLAVRHILLAADPENEVERFEAEDQAKQIIRTLNSDLGAFTGLAKQYSSCPSKETEGQLGQISRGQTVPEFERRVFNCQPGLVSTPIASRYGIHIVYVDHRDEGRQLPYEAVEKKIEEYLNEKVKRKAIAHYIDSLIAGAEIDGIDFASSASPLLQ